MVSIYVYITILLFLISGVITYALTPLTRKLALKLDILDQPVLDRKIHRDAVPLLGGLSIYVSFFLMFCLFYIVISYLFINGYMADFSPTEVKLFFIRSAFYLVGATIMLIIGLLDDIKLLDYRLKLLAQVLSACIIVLGGMRLDILPWPMADRLFSILWIVVITNSLNLLDNMNGLSSGIAMIICLLFVGVSFFTSHVLLAMYFVILSGCLVGFLPHNFPKAKIFLGDGGSLFIGFSIATYSLWLFRHLQEIQTPVWTLSLGFALLISIPIIDTLTVILIRLKNRRPIYVGDTNHLSHQLTRVGVSTTNAVLILYASAVGIGMVGFLSLI